MKKLRWLVALYAVVRSTSGFDGWLIKTGGGSFIAMSTEESAKDLAEAMNQAHNRRTGIGTPDVLPPCLGAICGEDDFVGKEPK